MDLPLELITFILEYVVGNIAHTGDTGILRVNTLFHDVAGHILYSNLTFHSNGQLRRFAGLTFPLRWKPRTILVVLSGGTADFDVFRHLAGALLRCGARQPEPAILDQGEQFPLERLEFCMHSHSRNPNLRDVFSALTLAKYVY